MVDPKLSPEDLSTVVDPKLLVRREFRQINLASGHHTGIFEEIKMHFENPGSGNQRGCSRPKLEISFGRKSLKEFEKTMFFDFLHHKEFPMEFKKGNHGSNALEAILLFNLSRKREENWQSVNLSSKLEISFGRRLQKEIILPQVS